MSKKDGHVKGDKSVPTTHEDRGKPRHPGAKPINKATPK